MKKNIIQIALFILIIILAYLVYESIMEPVRYNKERNRRREIVINKLKDIRTAQLNYKNVNKEYADSWDKLIDFLKNGKLPVIKKISTLPDSLSEISEEEAIKRGFIKVDTTYVNALDSLFGHRKDFSLENFSIIPFSDGQQFSLRAGEIEKGHVKVKVFEVVAPNEAYLKGLDKDMINKEEKPALILGSMTEASHDGNWE